MVLWFSSSAVASLTVLPDGEFAASRSQDLIQRVRRAPLRVAGRCLHSVDDPVMLVTRNRAKRKAFRSLRRNCPHSIPLSCLIPPPPITGSPVHPDPRFLNSLMYTLTDQVNFSPLLLFFLTSATHIFLSPSSCGTSLFLSSCKHPHMTGSAAIGDSISSDEEVIDGDKWSRDGDLPLHSGEAGRRMSSKPALGRKQTPDSFTTKLLTDRSLSLECSNERSHLPLSPSCKS